MKKEVWQFWQEITQILQTVIWPHKDYHSDQNREREVPELGQIRSVLDKVTEIWTVEQVEETADHLDRISEIVSTEPQEIVDEDICSQVTSAIITVDHQEIINEDKSVQGTSEIIPLEPHETADEDKCAQTTSDIVTVEPQVTVDEDKYVQTISNITLKPQEIIDKDKSVQAMSENGTMTLIELASEEPHICIENVIDVARSEPQFQIKSNNVNVCQHVNLPHVENQTDSETQYVTKSEHVKIAPQEEENISRSSEMTNALGEYDRIERIKTNESKPVRILKVMDDPQTLIEITPNVREYKEQETNLLKVKSNGVNYSKNTNGLPDKNMHNKQEDKLCKVTSGVVRHLGRPPSMSQADMTREGVTKVKGGYKCVDCDKFSPTAEKARSE